MTKTLLLLFVFPILSWAQSYDVRTYGAKGDGVTNDFDALKAAVSAAVASRGTVTIPSGTFYVDFRMKDPIALSHGVRISGHGRNSIIRTNRATPTANQVLFVVARGDTGFFNDLSIVGPDSSGSWTSRAIGHAGGSSGLVRIDNLYIEGFSDGLKSDAGTTSILAYDSEFAKCGMGILFPGRLRGRVLVSGCTFRDTRPQTQLMQPSNYHGMYIYRQHEINVVHSRFLRITGYGVSLWDGDTSATTAGGTHLVSDCEFDTMSVGILSGSKRGSTDQISACRFIACQNGIKIQEGNAEISGCEFRPTGAVSYPAVASGSTSPGNVSVSNSTFYLPATDPSAPGVLLSGTTSATWKLSSCIFWGFGGQNGSGVYNKSTGGTMLITGSQFYGTYSSNYTQAAILNESGSISVDGSNFEITGDAIQIVPRGNSTTTSSFTRNTVKKGTNFLWVWPASAGAVINIYGGGNFVSAGGEFFDHSDPALVRNYQLGNRVGPGGIIQSSGTITLSRNYDTWNVQGTKTINTIAMAGTYYASEFGPCKINLVADGTFSLGSGGNIIPFKTTPRTSGEVIHLEYDTAAKKWKERPVEDIKTGALTPSRYALSQNFPNPFNPNTSIEYSTPKSGHVLLEIFNILGQHIATLFSGEMGPGTQHVVWDATGQPSGTYLCRLLASDFVATRQLLLLK
jgi:hypothetical protein